MNRLASIILVIILLTSARISAQQNNETTPKVKFGAGIDIEFTDWNSYPLVPPSNIVLSFDLFNIIRIEPGIGLFNENTISDRNITTQDSKKNRFSIESNLLINSNQVIPFLGVYYDFAKTTLEYDSDFTSQYNESRQTRIGPVFGLEYNISAKCRIGVEFMLLKMSNKSKYIHDNESGDGESEGWRTGSKIKFRLYL